MQGIDKNTSVNNNVKTYMALFSFGHPKPSPLNKTIPNVNKVVYFIFSHRFM